MTVSTFQNLSDPSKPMNLSVDKILKRFKTEDKNGIADLKNQSAEEYSKSKNALPIVCFGGTFSYRKKDHLMKASGLMVLDFDKVPESFRTKLETDEFIYSCFASPSGKGFKALVKIPVVENDDQYKSYYLSFMDRYEQLDTSGKDISRACFFCYDPDLYVCENSLTWDKVKKEDTKPLKKLNTEYTDYSTANRCLNIIRNAVPGERHTKILAASRLMGGYVASGAIDYDEALRLLEQEAYVCDPDDFKVNEKAIKDGLAHGMKDPIEVTEKLEKEEELKEKFGKIYFTAHDLTNEIKDLYDNGVQKGYDVGFQSLNDLYTVKMGSTTYIYGPPYSGKSQFWFEILVNLSITYGLKHLVFSSETGTASEVFAELMSMAAAADFYDSYGKKMSIDKYESSKEFVDKHFIVLDPKDHVLTVQDVFDYADIIERVYNVKLHTVTIDPWNEIMHNYKEFSGFRDQYLEMILGKFRENARARERHNCIITHVADQQIVTDKSGVRYYPPATFREIAGGQAWSRKGMSMISVWRPPFGLNDSDGFPFEKNESHVIIQKSKPKGVGNNGTCKLFYDPERHRYYEYIAGKSEYGRPISQNKFETKINYSDFEHREPPF